ncbi:MAG: cytidyltransferase-related domain protein [Candidatus Nanosalina sp. J07AB43]|nr:MAG: cytidyltransferase-related domain protein [Candidatus Nanosalina sp. J07AB43]
MAQGTFDLLHPGHIKYLEKSSSLGDKLVVVIARDSRVKDRKNLAFTEKERRKIIQGLEAVDEAILGSEGDIYSTVQEVDPDIITIGYDQDHSKSKVKKMAEDAVSGEVKVERIDSSTGHSSSDIKQKLCDQI